MDEDYSNGYSQQEYDDNHGAASYRIAVGDGIVGMQSNSETPFRLFDSFSITVSGFIRFSR